MRDSLIGFPPSASLAELIHHKWVRVLGHLERILFL